MQKVLRSLLREYVQSTVFVVTLAVGLGIAASTYQVVDRLVFRVPGGIDDPTSLRRVFVVLPRAGPDGRSERGSFSYPEYRALSTVAVSQGTLTAYASWPDKLSLRLNGGLTSARVLPVAPNYFGVLGITPRAGRFLSHQTDTARSDEGLAEAVVSEAYWRRNLASSLDLSSAVIELASGRSLSIVGVVPSTFDGIGLESPDFWIPWEGPAIDQWGRNWRSDAATYGWHVVARLSHRDGAAELATRLQLGFGRTIRDDLPPASPSRIHLQSLVQAKAPDFARESRLALAFWAVSLVTLASAALTLGNFRLVRALAKRRDTAIAVALGATRKQLMRELLTEAIVLSVAGTILGLAFSQLGSALVKQNIAEFLHWDEARLDARTFLYAAGLGLGTGVLGSLVPALLASRFSLTAALGGHRIGSPPGLGRSVFALHAGQAAFTVLAVSGAALFWRSAMAAGTAQLGFDPSDVTVLQVDARRLAGSEEGPGSISWPAVARRLEQLPAVRAAGIASTVPFRTYAESKLLTSSSVDDAPRTAVSSTTPGYFAALKLHLVAGRTFLPDSQDADVVVVNLTASKLLGAGSPLGKCLRLSLDGGRCRTVVGVVQDTKRMDLQEAAIPQVWIPLRGETQLAHVAIFARLASGAGERGMRDIQAFVEHEYPSRLVTDRWRLDDEVDKLSASWTRAAQLLAIFGVATIVLLVFGLYSTFANDIIRRKQEWGVRLALGENPARLARMVVCRAVACVAAGSCLGAMASVGLSHAIRSIFFMEKYWDPVTLTGTVLAALAIGATSGWIAARRVGLRDPSWLLRS